MRAEEALVGVDADRPPLLLLGSVDLPRPQPPATWKTTREPRAIWLSAVALHFAWSLKVGSLAYWVMTLTCLFARFAQNW